MRSVGHQNIDHIFAGGNFHKVGFRRDAGKLQPNMLEMCLKNGFNLELLLEYMT